MENRDHILQEEMRKLIAESCSFKNSENNEFKNFHKSFLKFFFNAIDLNIDYDSHLISIWNSKPLTTDPIRLYDLNEAVADKVGYSDLEETLAGCLEEGQLQNNFYKKMLLEYGDCSNEKESNLSA